MNYCCWQLPVRVLNIRYAASKFYCSFVFFTLSVTKFKQLPRTHCKQLKNIQMLCHVLFFFLSVFFNFISQLCFVVRQAFQARKPEHTSRRNAAYLLLRFLYLFEMVLSQRYPHPPPRWLSDPDSADMQNMCPYTHTRTHAHAHTPTHIDKPFPFSFPFPFRWVFSWVWPAVWYLCEHYVHGSRLLVLLVLLLLHSSSCRLCAMRKYFGNW